MQPQVINRKSAIPLGHHFAKDGKESFHLRPGADRYAQKLWQGGENTTDFHTAPAQRQYDWTSFLAKIDHEKVGVRRDVLETRLIQFAVDVFSDFTVTPATLLYMFCVSQARSRPYKGHNVYAVPCLMHSHALD